MAMERVEAEAVAAMAVMRVVVVVVAALLNGAVEAVASWIVCLGERPRSSEVCPRRARRPPAHDARERGQGASRPPVRVPRDGSRA